MVGQADPDRVREHRLAGPGTAVVGVGPGVGLQFAPPALGVAPLGGDAEGVEQGQRVSAGSTMALAFDDGGIYVTARVPTTVIDQVHLGAPIDLAVDASPHATVTGVVREIQSSTAGEFDIYPSPDQNTANPQRVKEWVPVKITFTDTAGATLLPGMNVTARIHRT